MGSAPWAIPLHDRPEGMAVGVGFGASAFALIAGFLARMALEVGMG